MPATQPNNDGLWITLRDLHGEIAREHAENGEDAIRVAIVMLAHLTALKDGDTMTKYLDWSNCHEGDTNRCGRPRPTS